MTTIDTRAYDDGGRLTSSSYNNGVSESRTYNSDNTLASINYSGAAIGDLSYGWDANKNKTSESIGGVMSGYGFSAGYDAEDRLTSWNRSDTNLDQSWNLSPVGNWNSITENASVQNRTHGPVHELLTAANQSVEHDVKGNMTRIPPVLRPGSDPLNLKWDFENKLRAADTDNDGTDDVFYRWDALGRRVGRDDGTSNVVYFQDGQQTIADYPSGTATGSPIYTYVYASYIDEPVLRMDSSSGAKLYYHCNQQYSITAVNDGGGSVVERYAYSAYGQVTIADASGSVISSSAISNRYTYTGREWDEGLNLYHYRARMYDAVAGRFCSKDPIGYEGSRYSLYEYVSGRVVSAVDPTGLRFGIVPTGPFIIPFLFSPQTPTIIPVHPAPTIAEQCTYAASQGIAPAAPLTNAQCPYGPNDLYAADFVMYDADKRPCSSKCEPHTIIHRALGSSGTGGGGKCTARIAWPLDCVCKNMPNNPWSTCMRGCLACIYKKQGSGPGQEQHQECAQACYLKHPTWPTPIVSDLERAIFKCAKDQGVITVGGGRGTEPGPLTGPVSPDKSFDCDGCGAGPRRIRP